MTDEATSALDAESEQVVQEALDRLLEQHNMTTIVIAHRLQTVRNADIIAVLHEGMVAEIGSHNDLVASEGGMYKMMVERANLIGRDVFSSDIGEEVNYNIIKTKAK